MSSVSKDNLGLFFLNHSLCEQLKSYLSEKQQRLAHSILSQLCPKLIAEHAPTLAPTHEVRLLSYISYLEENQADIHHLGSKISAVNQEFWHFVEILEGNVVELFQRIQSLGIFDWNDDLYLSVMEIADLLSTFIEDVIVSIKRLETILQGKRQTLFGFFNRSILDKNLLKNLFQTQSFLDKNTLQFQQKYEQLNEMNSRIARKSRKFKNFISFSSLDKEHGNQFLNLYKVLKLWEENKIAAIFSRIDFLKAIKQKAAPGKSYLLIKLYLNNITKWFFQICEEWRLERSPVNIERVEQLKSELLALKSVTERYRNMILNTDPDPYVRARLGFKEWIVGQEPKKSKDLLELVYSSEEILRLFEKYRNAVQEKVEEEPKAKQARLKTALYNTLHEMGQPLASKSMIRFNVDTFVELLDDCDEIGGSAGHVESLITDTLLKAFRIDWHYQLLFENPKFHELWTIHIHTEKQETDFMHEKRMGYFRKMVKEIENWVKQNDTFKHVHEIETEISDTKEQLQEYLSQVKRRTSSLEGIEKSLYKEKVKLQVLEYYELFDRFFFFLKNYEVNGKMILQQFVFVDQYLSTTLQAL